MDTPFSGALFIVLNEVFMFELHSRLQADARWLGDLPLCRVLLAKDSQYPWLILVRE